MLISKFNNAVIRMLFPDAKLGEEQNILLMSDVYADNPQCNTTKLIQDLRRAREIKALVICAGDLFDAVGGREDPRRSPEAVKMKNNTTDYFDKVLADVDTLLSPFADMFVMLGLGNHEHSVRKHHGTNLIERLVDRWRMRGSPVVAGGYGGFIRFGMGNAGEGTPRAAINMYYHHGKGGTSAPVTRGMIETNRQAVWLEDVQVILNGHNHQNYITKIPTLTVGKDFQTRPGTKAFIRTPGYLNAWTDNSDWDLDYSIQSNTGPQANGSILMKLRLLADKAGVRSISYNFEDWMN